MGIGNEKAYFIRNGMFNWNYEEAQEFYKYITEFKK